MAIPAEQPSPTLPVHPGAHLASVQTQSRVGELLELSGDFERFMQPEHESFVARESATAVVAIQGAQLKMLGFSQRQVDAFQLITQWEGQTGPEYLLLCLLATLRMSFEDLQTLACQSEVGPDRRLRREQAWARKHYQAILVLLDGKGGAK